MHFIFPAGTKVVCLEKYRRSGQLALETKTAVTQQTENRAQPIKNSDLINRGHHAV